MTGLTDKDFFPNSSHTYSPTSRIAESFEAEQNAARTTKNLKMLEGENIVNKIDAQARSVGELLILKK